MYTFQMINFPEVKSLKYALKSHTGNTDKRGSVRDNMSALHCSVVYIALYVLREALNMSKKNLCYNCSDTL